MTRVLTKEMVATLLVVGALLQGQAAHAQFTSHQTVTPLNQLNPLQLHSYEVSPAVSASDCDVPEDVFSRGGYGCHAIVWRGQAAGVSYSESANMCYGLDPFITFTGPNSYCLEGNESASGVFPAGDPAGAWETHHAASSMELAVGAAMAMHRWQSPVYAPLAIDGVVRSVAIERVSFMTSRISVLAPVSPTVACGWLGFSSDDNLDNVDLKCAYYEASRLQLSSIDIVYWDSVGRHDRSLSNAELDAAVREYQRAYEPNGHKQPKLPYVLSKP